MALRLSGARLLALARLVRPLNLVAIGLAAWVGARLAHAPAGPAAILVPVLIGAFGYARNDAVDLAADRFNRPDRPVASGELSARAASRVAWGALLIAAALLVLVPPSRMGWGIAAAAALALYLYSPWLKDRGAAGPLAIAALTLLAVLWGAQGGVRADLALLAGTLAAAAQFARECVKQLEDAPGDRASGRTTWAVRRGAVVVTRAARAGLVAALLLLPLPATAGGLDARYLWAALPTSGLLLLGALAALGVKTPRYRAISQGIKAALFAGLLALAWAA
ncbi:MAG TPA: UbiA family prenyltransferase [Candidatus Eisenbacteria bacterium]|nr:UbiA family prenyltransferase [Candidatus Eisenbacteria bacterium]